MREHIVKPLIVNASLKLVNVSSGTCNGLLPECPQPLFEWAFKLLWITRNQFSFCRIYLHTVQCHFNAVKILQNFHNRHPIARLWGWSMGVFCEYKVWYRWANARKTYISPLLMHWSYVFLALTHQYMFCCCYRSAVCNIVINWIML